MVQPRHIDRSCCSPPASPAAAAMPCSIRSAAFTSPGKQADWMKSDGQASVADAADLETTGIDARRHRTSRSRPRTTRCSRAPPRQARRSAGARRRAGEAGCKAHRGRRCRRHRRSRRAAAASRREDHAAARPRLSVPRRRRPDLFARHRQAGGAHQAHRHPRQRRDLSAVAPDRRRGDPRLSPRSAADHADRPFDGRRLRLGLRRNAQLRPASRSACSSPTIPPASPTTCRPMSSATSTSTSRRISWAAAMSCRARASTAIMRATISRTTPRSFTSISRRPTASRSNWWPRSRSLPQTPADAEGEAVPIHLEVPADAAIELWDSGLPVAAHAGDTLKTLAATYHVPLWALAQINSVPEREPLAEGQRIVVPRHLVPMPDAQHGDELRAGRALNCRQRRASAMRREA